MLCQRAMDIPLSLAVLVHLEFVKFLELAKTA